MVKKGEFVRIHSIVFQPHERAPQVPDDTKKVPLELWVKGYLNHDAEIGDEVIITTLAGRKEKGTLLEGNLIFHVNYGIFMPEIIEIDRRLDELLCDGVDHD